MVANLGLIVNNPGSDLNIPIVPYLEKKPNSPSAYVEEFDGKIVSIGIDDPGNGYLSGVPITLEGGGGSNAELNGIFIGSIDNINNLIGGNLYTEKPNIIFEGVGLRADAICEISGYIATVDIADPGCYSYPPDIVVDGDGKGAQLKAHLSGYIYKTVLLSGGKFPIDVIPTINIVSSGNINYGGNIVPIMKNIDSNYSTISALSIASEGFGYPTSPSLQISGNVPGFPALAYCLINGGISSVEILNPGSGYTSIPKLNIIRRELVLPISSGNTDSIYQIIESQTPTQTPTPTPSFTPTNTVTKTVTVTNSCTNTITGTQVSSPTPTPTRTPVSSPTNRALHGPIDTQNLPTSTASPSPTTTKTVTPSSTVTPSFTASPTVTRTQTQTQTITKTSTSTPTITKTSTQTPTFSATQTLTPSQTINIFSPTHDAILIPRMAYGVSKINILQGGSYRTPPTIVVKPPVVANYKADIINVGNIRSFAFDPSLTIRGSTIASPYKETREPKAIPVIDYSIASVEIISAGSNYTIAPTINLIGGYNPISGIKAQLTAVVGSGGQIDSVTIQNPGSMYKTAPYISIMSNDYGYGLDIKVTLSGTLSDIYITDPGLNLTQGTPNTRIFIEGGGGPINSSAKISLSNPDFHYGDHCIATPELNYRLRSIEIINPGSGYICPPNIIIPSGENFQKDFSNRSKARPAKAQAKILGLVKKIFIENTGLCLPEDSGYIWLPNIAIGCGPISTNIGDQINKFFPGNINIPGSGSGLSVGSYNIDYDYSNLKLFRYLFPQKPFIFIDDNAPHIYANTYLEVSSIGCFQSGAIGYSTDSRTIYLTTDKAGAVNDYHLSFRSLSNSYSNLSRVNNFNDFYDVSGRVSTSDNLMIRGDILGLSFPNYVIDFNNSTHSYIEYIGNYNSARTHQVSMAGFFSTPPTMDIEDEIGSGANVILSSNLTNSMIRLYDDFYGDTEPAPMMIDQYAASGIVPLPGMNPFNIRSDLSINGAYDYTSRAMLVCKEPGVPLSWNNKPSFSVEINNGKITTVNILDGGKGFFPQNANTNGNYNFLRREIYFSGGGGSGARARYVTDFSYNEGFVNEAKIYTKDGSISGVTIISSGDNYVSEPEAIVIDYNPTWKDYYFHNKIYPYSDSLSILPGISPFQLLDFYFKNPIIYDYQPFINNYGVINSQVSLGILPQYDDAIATNSAWLHKDPWVAAAKERRYFHTIFGKNGRVDNILFVTEVPMSNSTRWPFDSPDIYIQNAGVLSDLGYNLPVFSAYTPRWNKEIFSETTLIRDDNVIE